MPSQNFIPHLPLQAFRKKSLDTLLGKYNALSPLENHLRIYAPKTFAIKCGLKRVEIFNLAKRIV